MPFTLGDLILLEIALVEFAARIDLSTHAGQQISKLMGKIEYQISALQQAAQKQVPLTQPPGPPEPAAGQ